MSFRQTVATSIFAAWINRHDEYEPRCSGMQENGHTYSYMPHTQPSARNLTGPTVLVASGAAVRIEPDVKKKPEQLSLVLGFYADLI
ncbi:unnamed protein product [Ceratitis capitata]|uniref:(Mediterranean fruit fly) hypothetical protein n=1 Tax=Ceratitis capitata TaxID=7213 RepID=A0A811U942_CERCA|nr:unnamed protein product [Ceratitis capitata]